MRLEPGIEPLLYHILGIDFSSEINQEMLRLSALEKLKELGDYNPFTTDRIRAKEYAISIIKAAYHILSDPEKREDYDLRCMFYFYKDS